MSWIFNKCLVCPITGSNMHHPGPTHGLTFLVVTWWHADGKDTKFDGAI